MVLRNVDAMSEFYSPHNKRQNALWVPLEHSIKKKSETNKWIPKYSSSITGIFFFESLYGPLERLWSITNHLVMKKDNVSKWCWNTKVLVKLLTCKIRTSLFLFAENKPWVMLKHSNLTISKPNTWVPGSLWRRANARKVSFETLHGRQFTLSKLIIPNYIKPQPQLFSFWSVVNKIVLMTRYAKLLWTFHDNKRCMMQ